jgi:hypothetical protein
VPTGPPLPRCLPSASGRCHVTDAGGGGHTVNPVQSVPAETGANQPDSLRAGHRIKTTMLRGGFDLRPEYCGALQNGSP